MTRQRQKALGRSLSVLLGDRGSSNDLILRPEDLLHSSDGSADSSASASESILQIPLEDVQPNPHQPRQDFEAETLAELADSIREHGILQPLLVSPRSSGDGKYSLLAGERRLRAAQIAGLATVPARVIAAEEVARLEIALIENVQREDLNPVEEALAYQELAQAFSYSQDQIARRVGKSRVAVANSLRLLKLSPRCLDDLRHGVLTAGHARAVLMLAHPLQQDALRQEIVDQGLTVRQAEERARRIQEGNVETAPSRRKKTSAEPKEDVDVVHLQERLVERLGCRVRVRPRGATSGTLEIAYANLDDLDRVLSILGVSLND